MKTKINHFFGRQDAFDLQLVKLSMELGDTPESVALDNGWSIYDGKWMQSRLTRIRVDAFIKTPKPIKGHTVEYVPTMEKTPEVDRVYEAFLEARGFKPHFDLYCDLDRASLVSIKKDGVMVAFTKFIEYDGGVESQFTAWDYAEPKLSLGRKIVDFEIQFAKDLGHEHIYFGPGYDESSFYKAGFPGFEWWDGDSWSTDKDKYLDLCRSDASVNTLEELNQLFKKE